MELKKLITDFIHEFDEEFTVTFNDDEGYYYETSTHTINIALSKTYDDCGFMRHLKEIHKCSFANDIDLLVWAMLHEIGHWETEAEVDETDEDFATRVWLSLTPYEIRDNETIQDRYYNLPIEFAATDWAYLWAEENYEKAVEVSKKFKKEMRY